MFGEHISNEEFGEGRGIDLVRGRDKDSLLGKPIDDNKDGCKAEGLGEVFDEVHGDRIPRTDRNRKWL